MTKTGAGTLTLTNANTYTGTTSINAGTLNTTNTNGLGGATGGTISLATGTTLGLNLGGATLANPNTIILTGTALLADTTASGTTDTLNNPFILTAAGTPTIRSSNAGATLALTGNITNNTAALTFNSVGNTTESGIIGAGSGGVTKTGTGTLTLTNANTYTGNTTINAGSLLLDIANALGSGTAVTLANTAGAVFDLNNFSDTIASLAGGGVLGGTVNLGSATLTTGGNNSNTTYSGIITGPGNLIKTGTGSMSLAGSNTYTGTTSVNAGTLSVTNKNALGTAGLINLNGGKLILALGGNTLQNQNDIHLNGGILSDNTPTATTDTLLNNIVINSPSTINSVNGGATLALNGTINGDSDLIIQGSGNVILNNTIGNNIPLSSLVINTTNTFMNSGSVHTTGDQTYNGAMTLLSTFSANAQSGNLNFNGIINGATNLTLGTRGNIFFNSLIGNIVRLGQIRISNTNNVTAIAQINSNTFVQSAGTGVSNYNGGLDDLDGININANNVTGNFYTPSSTISLNGSNSLNGNVTSRALIVNGQHGGTLFGTVSGTAKLGQGATGIFTLNGHIIGAQPAPNPINNTPNAQAVLMIINGILAYPYGQVDISGPANNNNIEVIPAATASNETPTLMIQKPDTNNTIKISNPLHRATITTNNTAAIATSIQPTGASQLYAPTRALINLTVNNLGKVFFNNVVDVVAQLMQVMIPNQNIMTAIAPINSIIFNHSTSWLFNFKEVLNHWLNVPQR